jgi:hypothetical protein
MGKEDKALHRFRKLRARIRPGSENFDLDWFPRRPRRISKPKFEDIRAKAWAALARYDDEQDRKLPRLFAKLGFPV